jgi:limonene-1,2-epoxide hydrolase
MHHLVSRFQQTFNTLNKTNISIIKDLYAEEVLFVDPLHEVRGLRALETYFAGLYAGTILSEFDFQRVLEGPEEAMLTWTMRIRHRSLRPNETATVAGASHIRWNDRVTYHRDYFDAGALLYERIPVLGAVVRHIKARV